MQRRRAAPVVHGAGTLRYVRSPDHQHWHLLGFDRYELRRAGGGATVVRDRKTGFCLGDRYPVTTRELAAEAAGAAVHGAAAGSTGPACSASARASRSATATTTPPTSRASTCRSTACAAGRYVLVHEVNSRPPAASSPHTTTTRASVLRLRRRRGVPRSTCSRSAPPARMRRTPTTPQRVPGARSRAAAARPAALRVETVATGLEIPWDIAFLPGRARAGDRAAGPRPPSRRAAAACGRAPVARDPVSALGEGGLLGLAVDPAFAPTARLPVLHDGARGCGSSAGAGPARGSPTGASLIDGIRAGTVHDSGPDRVRARPAAVRQHRRRAASRRSPRTPRR